MHFKEEDPRIREVPVVYIDVTGIVPVGAIWEMTMVIVWVQYIFRFVE